MAAAMSHLADVLRIRIQLSAAPLHCEWTLVTADSEDLPGTGLLTALPQDCARVEVVLPAADVLIIRRQLPSVAARRHSAALLAYAAEEVTAGDPEDNEVSWLGIAANGMDVLAVVDKAALGRWRTALAAAGIRDFQLHCETLLLPLTAGAWSLAWDGAEGCVRTGTTEGSATDSGNHVRPPLSLQLLVTAAKAAAVAPATINLYLSSVTAEPDLAAWSQVLGVEVHPVGFWHWGMVVADPGPVLAQQTRRWQWLAGLTLRLRPALWMLFGAVVVHGVGTISDWTRLATQQHELRAQMESRFREVFPEAVAVADPVLQMRRQLATARRATGVVDSGDFLPLVELVAVAVSGLPAGKAQILAYESGRLTLELAGVGAMEAQALLERLRQSGLGVELAPVATDDSRLILTVRPT